MRRSEYGPLVDTLDALHAEEVFGDEASRRSYLLGLSSNDFVDHYTWLNAKSRGIPMIERGLSEADYMKLGHIEDNDTEPVDRSYTSPFRAMRQHLLVESFEAAQRIGIDDMKRAATLLRVSAYAVHACLDGNTRTTAHAYSLLTRGYTASDPDRSYYASILQGEEARERHNLNTRLERISDAFVSYAMRHAFVDSGYEGSVPTYTLPFCVNDMQRVMTGNVGLDTLRAFGKVAAEDYFGAYNVAVLLYRKGLPLERFLAEDGQGGIAIDAVAVSRHLFVGDVSLLYGVHDEIKQRFIRSLHQSFEDDDPTIYGPIEDVVAHYRAR